MLAAFESKGPLRLVALILVTGLASPALLAQPAPGNADALNGPVPFIPRAALLRPARYQQVKLSPDGKWLAYVTSSPDGPEVQVAPVDDPAAARSLTLPKATNYRDFRWAFTNQHLLLFAGEPPRHLFSYDVADGKIKALTPQDISTSSLVALSERSPAEAVVVLAESESGQTTLSRVNIVTGQRQPMHVSQRFDGFLVDDSYRLRLAYKRTPDEGRVFALAEGEDETQWPSVLRIEPEDYPHTRPIAFAAGGDRLFVIDTRNSPRAELRSLDLATSDEETLASSPTLSVDGVLLHPSERTLQAVRFSGARTDWDFADDGVADDMQYLASVADGEVRIVSRSLDDERWIVAFEQDSAAREYFVFDRVARAASHLFAAHPPLEEHVLVPMHTAEIVAAEITVDGFLSLPAEATSRGRPDRPSRPLPAVVIMHDVNAPLQWGRSPLHQLLANRGYAVISVNQASQHERNEATLAAQWAVSEGIAVSDRIALMGRGTGGEEVLEAILRQPELFSCAIVEGSITALEKTLAGGRGPLDDLRRPLLLVGGSDKRHALDATARFLERRQVPVTCITYSDERDVICNPINQQSFAAILEAFLAERLDGRAEPFDRSFHLANPQVLIGSQHVPGLSQAISNRSSR